MGSEAVACCKMELAFCQFLALLLNLRKIGRTKREFLRQETTSGGRVVAMWG